MHAQDIKQPLKLTLVAEYETDYSNAPIFDQVHIHYFCES